jgi:Flp pilus assembly protein TadG
MVTKRNTERGAALIESAITIPIILLICVALFDLGRAYQTWQVLTNAAREGARVSIIAGRTDTDVQSAVRNYMDVGGLTLDGKTIVIGRNTVDLPTTPPTQASEVTVSYPFEFIVLGPIMRMVDRGSTQGNALSMRGVAVMRNEN